MKKTELLKKLITIITLLTVVCTAAGCRPSHKLEIIRYIDNEEIDESQKEYDLQEDENLVEWLDNLIQDEASDDISNQKNTGRNTSDSPDSSSANIRYDSDAGEGKADDRPNTDNSKSGNVQSKDAGKDFSEFSGQEQVNDDIEYNGDSGTGDIFEELNGGAQDKEPESSEDNERKGDEDISGNQTDPTLRPSDATGRTTITLEGGETVTIPTGAKKVAATGFAAQMVEITGGSGRLAGTNANLYANTVFENAVSDLDRIGVWWAGDGSSNITGQGLEALLADIDITVVFAISGQSNFSQDQVNALLEKNVQVVTLYPLDSIRHLKDDVTIIGTVLYGGTDTTAQRRAASYNSWVDSTLSSVKNSAGNVLYYTLCLAGWDDNAFYNITSWGFAPDLEELTERSGYGLAYSYTPWSEAGVFYNEIASYAGIKDTAVSTPKGYGWSGGSTDQYVYIEPSFGGLEADIDGGGMRYLKITGFTRFLVPDEDNTSINLGKNYFPAVIASTDEVKEKVSASIFWRYSGYSGPLYPVSSYRVYVNPQGMGSWLTGSVESPLEAVWLKWAVNDSGNSDKETVLNTIVNFYSEYFEGCDKNAIRDHYVAQLDDYVSVTR